MDSPKVSEPATTRVLKGALLPILFLLFLAVLTYPGILTGGVILPTDWLYEAFYPWKSMAPSVVSANPRQNDAVMQLYPLDLFTRERMLEGEVPLWNPYLGSGIPHLATGFNRVFYPLAWPGLLLSAPGSRNFEMLFHLVLAAVFQFLFLRRLGCGRAACLLGGMAFGWGSALAVRAPLNYVSDTLIWLPLLLFAVEGILRGVRGSVAVLGLAAGLQLLAGSLPDVLSAWILIGFFLLGRLIGQGASTWAKSLLRVGAGVLLGAMLSSVQLLPHLELVRLSHRGVRSYEELSSRGAPVESLATLLSPRVLGSDPDRTSFGPPRVAQLYIGIVGLVLALISLRGGNRRIVGSLLLAGVGTYLVASGTPLLYAIYLVFPPIAGLRYVHTFAAVSTVAFSALAALGVERLLKSPPTSVKPLGIALTLASVATVGLSVSSLMAGPTSASGNAMLELGTAFGLVAAVFAVLYFYGARRFSPRAMIVSLICLAAVDLIRFPAHQNPVTSLERFPIFPATKGFDLIAAEDRLYRTLTVVPRSAGPRGPWLAGPNSLVAYGIPDASAYHSLLPARLVRYYSVMERQFEGAKGGKALGGGRSFFNVLESYGFGDNPMARLMNIRYVLFRPGERPLDHYGLRHLYSGEMRVYQYVEQQPRAFFVRDYEELESPRAVLRRLVAPDFDPSQTVLLERSYGRLPQNQVAAPATPLAPVQVVTYRPEHVRLQVESDSEGILVLCDSYFPGWKASVNGEEAEILRANFLFRAVRLPSGRSVVDFNYQPRSYDVGILASLLGLVLILGLWIVSTRLGVGYSSSPSTPSSDSKSASGGSSST